MVIASIVRAGPEGIIPIIIVVVVIGKIIKAIKEASSRGPSNPAASSPPARKQGLEKDLEKFFERLADQGSPVAATPPPPPVPAAARPVRRAKPLKQVPPPHPMAARPVPAAIKPKAPAKWGSEHYGVDKSAPSRSSCSYSTRQSRQELINMLEDGQSVQKAILLREILGPPISLRGDPTARA